MRIFISADIEGIAGVATTSATVPGGHGYTDACRWMTQEVIAAVEGAKAAGATSFVIADGHGGADNLLLDALPDDVEVVRSWPRPLAMMQGIDSSFDAAFFIGYHTGGHHTDGVLAHTFRGLQIASVQVNGKPASELTVNAMIAHEFGVPVALVTGDHATCQHADEELNGVVRVAVKTECGRYSAQTLMPAEAQKRIKAAAQEAVSRLPEKPRAGAVACSVHVTFKHHWNAELLSFLPFAERTGPYSIAFEVKSASEAAGVFKFITSYQPLPPEA
ncbi:MAG: M55 family metallopeptidase [Pseudomonadota bacterium]